MGQDTFQLTAKLNLDMNLQSVRNCQQSINQALGGALNKQININPSAAIASISRINAQVTNLKANLAGMKLNIGSNGISNNLNSSLNKTVTIVHQTQSAFGTLSDGIGTFEKRMAQATLRMGAYISSALLLRKTAQEVQASFGRFLDIESKQVNLAQTTGNPKQAAQATGKIRTVSAKYGVPTEQLSDAYQKLAESGVALEKIDLDFLAKLSLNKQIKDAKDMAEAYVVLSNVFGHSATQIEEDFEKILAASKKSSAQTSEYFEGLKSSGSIFAQLKGNVSEYTAMFSVAKTATNKEASEIGNAFKTMFLRAATMPDVKKSLVENGINPYNKQGDLQLSPLGLLRELSAKTKGLNEEQGNQLIEKVSGTRQAGVLMALLQHMPEVEKFYAESLVKTSQIAKDAVIAQSSLGNQLQKTKLAFDNLIATFINDSAINGFARTVISLTNNFLKMGQGLHDILPLVLAMGGIKAANMIANRGYLPGGQLPLSSQGIGFPATTFNRGIGRGMMGLAGRTAQRIGAPMINAGIIGIGSALAESQNPKTQVAGQTMEMFGALSLAIGPLPAAIISLTSGFVQLEKAEKEYRDKLVDRMNAKYEEKSNLTGRVYGDYSAEQIDVKMRQFKSMQNEKTKQLNNETDRGFWGNVFAPLRSIFSYTHKDVLEQNDRDENRSNINAKFANKGQEDYAYGLLDKLYSGGTKSRNELDNKNNEYLTTVLGADKLLEYFKAKGGETIANKTPNVIQPNAVLMQTRALIDSQNRLHESTRNSISQLTNPTSQLAYGLSNNNIGTKQYSETLNKSGLSSPLAQDLNKAFMDLPKLLSSKMTGSLGEIKDKIVGISENPIIKKAIEEKLKEVDSIEKFRQKLDNIDEYISSLLTGNGLGKFKDELEKSAQALDKLHETVMSNANAISAQRNTISSSYSNSWQQYGVNQIRQNQLADRTALYGVDINRPNTTAKEQAKYLGGTDDIAQLQTNLSEYTKSLATASDIMKNELVNKIKLTSQALEILGNSANRTSLIEQKLNAIKEQEEGKRSLVKGLTMAGPFERAINIQSIATGISALGGGFAKMNGMQKQQAIRGLDMLPQGMDMGGGKTVKQLGDSLIEQLAPELFAGSRNEKETLQKQIVAIDNEGIGAMNALTKSQLDMLSIMEKIASPLNRLADSIDKMPRTIPLVNNGAQVKGMSIGGIVGNVFKPKGSDTIPAMLTKGEYVLRKNAVDKIGIEKLNQLNSGNNPTKYLASGGSVDFHNVAEWKKYREANITTQTAFQKFQAKQLAAKNRPLENDELTPAMIDAEFLSRGKAAKALRNAQNPVAARIIKQGEASDLEYNTAKTRWAMEDKINNDRYAKTQATIQTTLNKYPAPKTNFNREEYEKDRDFSVYNDAREAFGQKRVNPPQIGPRNYNGLFDAKAGNYYPQHDTIDYTKPPTNIHNSPVDIPKMPTALPNQNRGQGLPYNLEDYQSHKTPDFTQLKDSALKLFEFASDFQNSVDSFRQLANNFPTIPTKIDLNGNVMVQLAGGTQAGNEIAQAIAGSVREYIDNAVGKATSNIMKDITGSSIQT